MAKRGRSARREAERGVEDVRGLRQELRLRVPDGEFTIELRELSLPEVLDLLEIEGDDAEAVRRRLAVVRGAIMNQDAIPGRYWQEVIAAVVDFFSLRPPASAPTSDEPSEPDTSTDAATSSPSATASPN